jgi:hypothetical protein
MWCHHEPMAPCEASRHRNVAVLSIFSVFSETIPDHSGDKAGWRHEATGINGKWAGWSADIDVGEIVMIWISIDIECHRIRLRS